MSDHLITTPAVLVPCDGCARHVLACRAGGFRAFADPDPLSLAGEIKAWLGNRTVYDVIGWGIPRRLYLEYRDLMRIRCGRSYPVVGEHQCPSGRVPSIAAGFELAYPFAKPQKKKRKVPLHDRPGEIPF